MGVRPANGQTLFQCGQTDVPGVGLNDPFASHTAFESRNRAGQTPPPATFHGSVGVAYRPPHDRAAADPPRRGHSGSPCAFHSG